MKNLILTEFIILGVGTLFAWYNFGTELYSWLNASVCTLGCTPGVNPFLTPCFYGAIFFTLGFIVACILLAKSRKL